MYSTNKIWFKIVSFILALSFVISSFSSFERIVGGISFQDGRYNSKEVSVIKPYVPRYSDNRSADVIYTLDNQSGIDKDVSVKDKEDDNSESSSPKTPLEIFNYVRTHISSDLGIAFRRDADAVRKAGRATASENANLLAEMLREQGYEVKF
ncbi:MAG: transglutaminase domain-containing protein, partial [Eubacterium sp.]|nr:transglutaminase domain-containing protein [Eubacterium sp.]